MVQVSNQFICRKQTASRLMVRRMTSNFKTTLNKADHKNKYFNEKKAYRLFFIRI